MNEISTPLSKLFAGCGCFLPILAVSFFVISITNGFWIFGLLFGGILLFIALLIFGQIQRLEDRQKAKQKTRLLSFKMNDINFEKLPTAVSSDVLSRIAIDDGKRRVYLWLATNGNGRPLTKPKKGMKYQFVNYSFRDIEAAAIVEDGQIIEASYGSSIMGLEEFVANQATAAASSKQAVGDKVKSMALIIQVNHIKYPFHQIRFYHEPYKELPKKAPQYTAVFDEIQKWFDRMDTIIKDKNCKPDTPQEKVFEKAEQQSGHFPEEKLVIQSDSEPITYSLNLQAGEAEVSAETPEIEAITSQTEVPPASEAPKTQLSYFERIVAENKKQLTEHPARRE